MKRKNTLSNNYFWKSLAKITTYRKREKYFRGISLEQLSSTRRLFANDSSRSRSTLGKICVIWFYTGDDIHSSSKSNTSRRQCYSPNQNVLFYQSIRQRIVIKLFLSQISNRLKSTFTVYRRKTISNEEFHRFERVMNKLVLTNSFVSTSRNKEIAWRHCDQRQSQSQDRVSVVFVMKITLYDNQLKPIAFIEKDVRNRFENELLLTSGILFRVHSVK